MKMRKVFGQIAPEKIAALEEQYNFHLPQDYRDFLLSVGGGVASTLDEENSIPLEELHDGLDIGVLYGIGNATRASTIEHWMGKYWDEIWEHSVLIGDTQGGSFYVLIAKARTPACGSGTIAGNTKRRTRRRTPILWRNRSRSSSTFWAASSNCPTAACGNRRKA